MMAAINVASHVEKDTVADLARFIEDQAGRQCVRILLAQRVGDTHQTVDEWLIAEMLDARTLAEVVHSAGFQEAHTLRESVAYGVFAFRANSSVPAGRFVFRIEAGNEFQGRRTTSADRGIIEMLMNHTELSARLALGHSREIVDQYQVLLGKGTGHLSSLLEQAYARIHVLEKREAEAIELRDKLQSISVDRDLQMDALKRKDEMRRFALEKLGPVVPLLMAKLVGSGNAPGSGGGAAATAASGVRAVADAVTSASGNMTEELVDRLIQLMDPQQLGDFARLLGPEQLALFGQLYELSEARIQRARGESPGAQPATAQPSPQAEPSPSPPAPEASPS